MRQLIVLIAAVVGLTGRACAQSYTVTSISPVNLGNVAAGSAGETVLRVNPATGTVAVASGTGGAVAAVSGRSLITLSCGTSNRCSFSFSAPIVTVSAIGTPTNRAGSLRNLTISTAGATAVIRTAPGTGSSISFVLEPFGQNTSKTFWLGFDFPVGGDDSGASTGLSTAQFSVTVTEPTKPSTDTLSATVSANVFRALAITKSADLNFGKIYSPSVGSGTVSLNPTTGLISVTGTGTAAIPAVSPTVAQFAVSGEGGQSISVSVPSTFTMTAPGGTIQVTTSANVSGAQVLSGTAGSLGSLAIRVGGSYPVSAGMPTGTYSGTFAVVVQYN